jgi:hypothetical protein
MPTHVRVKRRALDKLRKSSPTVFKGTIDGNIETTMIKVTTSGEKADLEVKFIRHKLACEIIHLHCMKDHEISEYSRGKGPDAYKLYRITDGNLIQCKACNRKWRMDTSGDMFQINFVLPKVERIAFTGTPEGKVRLMSGEELIAWFDKTPLARSGVEPPFIARWRKALKESHAADG